MEWREHIGHHLEQFALTAVGEDDSDDDSDDGVDAGEKKAGIFRVDEFLTDQAGMYANTGNPKEPSVLQSPGDGTDQVREANDFTDSSNFGNAGAKNRKDAQDLWEGKVQDYLKKQPEGSKEPETQGTASPTVWLHIPERNEDFIGRDEDLGMLHESLATMGQICVLSGRGGVGKTATAVEYSHRFKTSYSHVFWLEAETSGRLADQYNSIGTKVFALGGESEQDPLSITLSVKEKLSRWDKTWLIVFDNVEAWRDVARYIPKGLDKTQGSVLITTRQQDLIRSETRLLHRLKLEPMTSEESSQFLLCSIFPKLDKEDVPLHEDYELAIQAADLVERLPLALIMVSGYVTVSKGSLELFLEIWDEKQRFRAKQARRSRLVTEGTLDSSIDLLWDIGISELSVPARNLLEILAFLDPENIPRDLLVGDHTENFLEFLNSTEASLYKRMIRQLRGQKLIDVKTGENGLETYSIHRLLQQKIIIELGMQLKFDSAMKKSTFLVRKKFPRSPVIQAPMPENWPQCKEYMPHVSSLLRAFKEAEELVPRFERTMEIAQLFIDAGFYVWDRQATEYDGLAFLNAAERVLDRHKVDANDKLRADIHCISGLLRNGMGCRQREESLRQLEVARNIRRHIYLEHPYNRDNDVLLQNAATDYGILLLNKYDFTRAENIFTSCLQQYRSWGSEKEIPFEYSKYYYNTGIVRMCQGRLDEAIRFLQRSVDLAKEYRGEEGQYWDNQFTLACVILQSGDVQRALDLHLQTLSAKLDLFGKHSKSTVLSTYAVGAMYAHISDIPTAIDYMENCIELAISSNWTEEALGRAQHYLARLYKKQGGFTREVEELESKAEAVLKKYSAFISGWIRETKEPILMFDDLQPTDEGRFTGRMLLKRLWERQENEELQSGSN
ncbi:Transcriptional xre family [Pleurostoma richardsiae]|uniref:Transcriptional xre family n=1 Tax=Pleurostoma richardsiae TaxID=41990 RepID=A0AA38RSY9_9PEZI|nr:Transcriptional xre family [Pleurostoma richardsiae]